MPPAPSDDAEFYDWANMSEQPAGPAGAMPVSPSHQGDDESAEMISEQPAAAMSLSPSDQGDDELAEMISDHPGDEGDYAEAETSDQPEDEGECEEAAMSDRPETSTPSLRGLGSTPARDSSFAQVILIDRSS